MFDLQKISKIYKSQDKEFHILNEIDLKILKGDFLSIVGPSGSGKTTLLNILGLVDHASQGKYLIEDKDTSVLSDKVKARVRNEMVGYVFQNYNLIENISVIENVLLPYFYRKNKKNRDNKNIKRRAEKLLAIVGLGKIIRQPIKNLSGGEKQRVAIARALINKPDIILADEPTGNLDWETAKGIMNLFKKLNKKGYTILMVTHNKEAALYTKKSYEIKERKLREF